MTFNPALNLEAFAIQSASAAPPSINAIYLRDGKYDNDMPRASVAATFAAFREQTVTNRLALFFHGGLVDKASGQQGAANEYDAYNKLVFPLKRKRGWASLRAMQYDLAMKGDAALPSKKRGKPFRPREPRTIRSAPQ
jgi:hypothetical protein